MEKHMFEENKYYVKVMEVFGPPVIKTVLVEKIPSPDIVLRRGKRLRQFWTNKYGEIHSKYGNPAEIKETGTYVWYKNGLRHRDGDMPAEIVHHSGSMTWARSGIIWREGLKPAMITQSNVYWYECGIQVAQISTEDVSYATQNKKRFKEMMSTVQAIKCAMIKRFTVP
jgi:hypothetical protein